MPMKRLPDPEPDFNAPGWHEDEFGSDLTPYPDDAAGNGAPDPVYLTTERYDTEDITWTTNSA